MSEAEIVRTASQLIDLWGGTTKVSERFGVLPSAVSNWRKSGFPPRLHYRIAKDAEAAKIVLAPELFEAPFATDPGDGESVPEKDAAA